jgi:hypothetical protein
MMLEVIVNYWRPHICLVESHAVTRRFPDKIWSISLSKYLDPVCAQCKHSFHKGRVVSVVDHVFKRLSLLRLLWDVVIATETVLTSIQFSARRR